MNTVFRDAWLFDKAYDEYVGGGYREHMDFGEFWGGYVPDRADQLKQAEIDARYADQLDLADRLQKQIDKELERQFAAMRGEA